MKKIIALIVLIIIAVLIYFRPNKQENVQEVKIQSSVDNPYNIDLTPRCSDYEKYFIIRKNKALQVGEDIVIKYKRDKEEKINCIYSVSNSDFEITGNNSDFFEGVYNNYLILNTGTGVDGRVVSIYDLQTRKKVYTNTFSGVSVQLNTSSSSLSFKIVADEIPNKDNCKNYQEIKDMGGNIGFEKVVTVDLKTLKQSISDDKECVYLQ